MRPIRRLFFVAFFCLLYYSRLRLFSFRQRFSVASTSFMKPMRSRNTPPKLKTASRIAQCRSIVGQGVEGVGCGGGRAKRGDLGSVSVGGGVVGEEGGSAERRRHDPPPISTRLLLWVGGCAWERRRADAPFCLLFSLFPASPLLLFFITERVSPSPNHATSK